MKRLTGLAIALLLIPSQILAQNTNALNIDINSFLTPGGFSSSINMILALAGISLIPFFLISTTCFLRIVIVMSMVRMAMQTQQSPPNMTLVALSMFLTVFVMTPVFQEIQTTAVQPYQDGKILQQEALDLGMKPIRNFMLKYAKDKDLALFLEFSRLEKPDSYENVPIFVIIPAYVISELKTAFQIGFLLFIPFVVIDLIVSNILLSLGMFMLSPAMISLPFKILLFVLTDGWHLITRGLLVSFQ